MSRDDVRAGPAPKSRTTKIEAAGAGVGVVVDQTLADERLGTSKYTATTTARTTPSPGTADAIHARARASMRPPCRTMSKKDDKVLTTRDVRGLGGGKRDGHDERVFNTSSSTMKLEHQGLREAIDRQTPPEEKMTIRDCAFVTVLWLRPGSACRGQTVSFHVRRWADAGSRDPAHRRRARRRLLAHLRRGFRRSFIPTLKKRSRPGPRTSPLLPLSPTSFNRDRSVAHPRLQHRRNHLDAFRAVIACDKVLRGSPRLWEVVSLPFLESAWRGTRWNPDVPARAGYQDCDRHIDRHRVRSRSEAQAHAGRQPVPRPDPLARVAPGRSVDNARRTSGWRNNCTGVSVKHVLLLHHSLTNALFLGDAIDMFRARGWKIVSPDEAFEDAAYKVAPMLPRVDGSVLETTAQALGVPCSRPWPDCDPNDAWVRMPTGWPSGTEGATET